MGCAVWMTSVNAFAHPCAHRKLFLFIDLNIGKEKGKLYRHLLSALGKYTASYCRSNVDYVSTLGNSSLGGYLLPQLEAQLDIQPLKD